MPLSSLLSISYILYISSSTPVSYNMLRNLSDMDRNHPSPRLLMPIQNAKALSNALSNALSKALSLLAFFCDRTARWLRGMRLSPTLAMGILLFMSVPLCSTPLEYKHSEERKHSEYQVALAGVTPVVTETLSQEEAAEHSPEPLRDVTVREFIMHHVIDSSSWHPFPSPISDLAVGFPNQKLFALGTSEVHFLNGLHALMLVFAFMILSIVFIGLYRRDPTHAPHGFTNLLETFILFIRNDISIEYLGKTDGKRFAPFFLTVFFMILSLNLMGLIPLFATATANVNITAAFALVTLMAMVIGGIARNGPIGFLKAFIPAGVPIVLVPFLFILEFMGLFIKPFALTIRLFANLLAGHIVIFSILGVIITFGIVGLPVLGLGLFIYLLEIFVAFLQAYIFTLLSAIFIGEMLHPAH